MEREWLNFSTFLGLGVIFVILWWYYHSNGYQERVVSRRKQRAQWKHTVEKMEEVLTKAVNTAADNGEIDRIHIDRVLGMLRRAGFREIGDNPSFGKPWYYGPVTTTNLKALKGRLKQKWDHVHLKWTKEGKAISESDTAKLRNSIKKAS